VRDDFCAVIVTHGRPQRVPTYKSLIRHGYTGRVFLVCDDEDETVPQYVEEYGEDNVLVFSKAEAAEKTDAGDNLPHRRSVVYARNAIFDLVEEQGFEHFIMLDDDYTQFSHRFAAPGLPGTWPIKDLDAVFEAMVEFLEETPVRCVAMSQGGDFIGGADAMTKIGFRRKVMNTFVCSVSKPYPFLGRLNDDVNTYTVLSREGVVFLTLMAVQVVQVNTQVNSGGLTELYLDFGTYAKSFYTVMFAPSCSVVASFKGTAKNKDNPEPGARIHHRISWNNAAPKIVPERFKKEALGAQ